MKKQEVCTFIFFLVNPVNPSSAVWWKARRRLDGGWRLRRSTSSSLHHRDTMWWQHTTEQQRWARKSTNKKIIISVTVKKQDDGFSSVDGGCWLQPLWSEHQAALSAEASCADRDGGYSRFHWCSFKIKSSQKTLKIHVQDNTCNKSHGKYYQPIDRKVWYLYKKGVGNVLNK